MKSSIGPLYLVASEKGLQGIFWKNQIKRAVSKKYPAIQALRDIKGGSPQTAKESKILLQAEQQITDYLAGKIKKFSIKLDAIHGTEFQQKVWKTLLTIPRGKTWSYQELAQKIGKPKAVRAVGSANAKNPLCIVVPCHRVIAANGTLGGYSGGLEIKQRLLDLEQNRLEQNRK